MKQHPWATVGSGRGGEYSYFDPEVPVEFAYGDYLPHWRQRGAVYFVTFRTADSVPTAVMAEWVRDRDRWLALNPEPHDEPKRREYHKRFTERMHRNLDDCHGECLFRRADVRAVLEKALLFKDAPEGDYMLDAYVIMPNHAHVLVSPQGEAELSAIESAWKNVSAHRINKLLGRHGTLWQKEGWDHLVRRPEHLAKFQRYIAANPWFLPTTAQPE